MPKLIDRILLASIQGDVRNSIPILLARFSKVFSPGKFASTVEKHVGHRRSLRCLKRARLRTSDVRSSNRKHMASQRRNLLLDIPKARRRCVSEIEEIFRYHQARFLLA